MNILAISRLASTSSTKTLSVESPRTTTMKKVKAIEASAITLSWDGTNSNPNGAVSMASN